MTAATLSAASPGSSRSRVSWWRELALLAALYGVYMLARALVGVHPEAAMDRGRWLLDLEATARIDIERPLNSAVHAVPALAVLADYVYARLHYLVTPLVWLALRHRDGYRRGRNALLIASALGLVGFWLLPTAPPRLLDAGAFLDMMAVFSDWGWWGEAASAPRGMEGLSNQYAALPSLHVGWALWSALQVRANTNRRLLRHWAWTYPALITVVVMATANHYLLDAVAGAAVVLAGHAIASRLPSDRSVDQPEGEAGDVGVVVHGSALAVPVPAMRLAPVLDADEPLPFGVGEVPGDIGELDDLECRDLDDAERLPVAV